jgi:hypothetical protein
VKRTTTIRLIVEQLPNLNIRKRLALKSKLDPERSLWFLFLFEEINVIRRQLKPKNTASSKKMSKEG